MNKQKIPFCFVFPMGMEAYPFLGRLEIRRRRQTGKAVYREAFFEGRSFLVVKCGIGPDRAAKAIRNMRDKPAGVICVGTAGGLTAELHTNDLVISAESVFGHEPNRICLSNSELVHALSDACKGENRRFKVVRMATVHQPIFPRPDRERLRELTGAHTVDMETHAVAVECGKLEIPFAALRVISDDLRSPGLPQPVEPKEFFLKPADAPRNISNFIKRKIFISKMHKAIGFLDPVLVRMIRKSVL